MIERSGFVHKEIHLCALSLSSAASCNLEERRSAWRFVTPTKRSSLCCQPGRRPGLPGTDPSPLPPRPWVCRVVDLIRAPYRLRVAGRPFDMVLQRVPFLADG